jgi:hypothetical protein
MRRSVGLLTAALLTAGCATALTPEHLAPSVAEVFGGLYASQQALLGRTDVHRGAVQPLASCRRSGPSSDGPGEDWSCTVQYVDGGAAAAQSFEVNLKPDGCWTADGPPATQPAQLTDAVTGAQVRNPLGEFDGCLDTSWH